MIGFGDTMSFRSFDDPAKKWFFSVESLPGGPCSSSWLGGPLVLSPEGAQ
jgi:hypothetical protein